MNIRLFKRKKVKKNIEEMSDHELWSYSYEEWRKRLRLRYIAEDKKADKYVEWMAKLIEDGKAEQFCSMLAEMQADIAIVNDKKTDDMAEGFMKKLEEIIETGKVEQYRSILAQVQADIDSLFEQQR